MESSMNSNIVKIALAIIVNLIPLVYSGYLYIKLQRLIKTSTVEEMEENDQYIGRLRKSMTMFFLIGVFLTYQNYKINFS